ncbi:MAG: O-antigen polymerase [Azospirillum brasilense]|nr:MAG: O-antigen polymerase [Azospirillum brasilense]
MPRFDAAAPGSLAGMAAAVLFLAGALKSVPQTAALPDITLLSAGALAVSFPWLLASRRWTVLRPVALPLAAAGALWLWMVLAATWSSSAEILSQKLPEAVLLGPAMLAAGMATGADAAARRWLVATAMLTGPFVAAGVAWGLASGDVVLGGLVGATDATRVQYQLAGLAMACGAGLAAVRLVEAGPAARIPWALLLLGLALGALLPGGRAALLSLGVAVTLAPVARLWTGRRPLAAAGWIGAMALVGGLGLGLLYADPGRSQGLRTLERFTGEGIAASARPVLWSAALDWAGAAMPLGLGAGGFTVAAGYGERRGMYPHNHALECLAEEGPLGLLLWLGAFGGGAALVLVRLLALPEDLEPERAGRIVALVIPVAIGAMVSTDLGNRMVWFALGLALSLGIRARRV